MNTYEICKTIQNLILATAGEVVTYTNWSDKFATNQLRETRNTVLDSEWFKEIDPNNLTAEQMDNLGFSEKLTHSPVRLIPVWLYPYLAKEFRGASIMNKSIRILKYKEIDNDNRGGYLAYGVMSIDTINQLIN